LEGVTVDFRELLSRHAAIAIEKQLRLARSVAGSTWSWDLLEGSFCFGDRAYAFQLLGIELAGSDHWRWGWADADGLPARLLGAAHTLRAFGHSYGVSELVEDEVPLDEVSGQEVAALACGLLDMPGWWRAPFNGGVAWLLLTDRALPRTAEPPPAEMARVLTRTLAIFPVDHAIALDAYVVHHGGSVERLGATATARMRDGGHMVARFDEAHRIERLEAKVA
jgi:hypothetical protein